MKKLINNVLNLFLLAALFAAVLPVHEASAADSVKAYVSIANGTAVVANEEVTVTDVDNDGAITVYDALYAAHEKKFNGGAAAGFAAVNSDWGLSLTKLWGVENGGSYGYTVNNALAMSLADAVKDGDYVYAYVYQDTSFFSDMYTFFDKNTVSADKGSDLSVKLSGLGYDESWNSVTLPVSDAIILINGEKTSFKTDANGAATITLPKDAKNTVVISAVSDAQTLVPPVLTVSINSSVNIALILCIVVGVIAVCAVVVLVLLKKKD